MSTTRREGIAQAGPGLLEREHELATVAARVEAARMGAGAVLVVEGPAGIGKTRLLAEAQTCARAAGMDVLRARGGDLERHFPFGVVRQLFEPLLAGARASERRALLHGAASLAAPLFGLPTKPMARSADDPFATIHGLYWLSANLAARSPLLLALDDAHWADAPSLRWLLYLAGRIEELPILVTATLRRAEPDTELDSLSRLVAAPSATVLEPARLSASGVAAFVRATLSGDVDPDFCNACHTATQGNPFLLEHLLAVLGQDGVQPTALEAVRVRKLAPESVARAVVLRLARMPAAASLARAVAVLEAGSELRHAAALAGIEEEEAQQAADALAHAEILARERPLDFVHPIVRQAIYADIPAGERAGQHARAARLLADEAAPPEAVAVHLLLTEPRADRWVVDMLRNAAGRALARGAPEVAVSYLRRALREPSPRDARPALLFELGAAESRAREPAAAEHLKDALDLSTDARERARIARALGRLLTFSGQGADAIELLEPAIAALGDAESELALRLEADLNLAAWFASPPRTHVTRRLAQLSSHHRSADLLLANLAFQAFMAGEPARVAAELAERALAGRRLLAEESSDSPAFQLAVSVLTLTDRLEHAERAYADAQSDALRRGSAIGFAVASCWRALNHLFRGNVADAETDARQSLAVASEHGWELGLPLALAFLADALLERAELGSAAQALESRGIGDDLPESLMFQPLLHSRGRLRIAQGRIRDGLEDLVCCGEREERWGIRAPGMTPWRVPAALALAAAGERHDALQLLREELVLARRFGSPRPLGAALRAHGLVEGGETGLERLREAVALLERSSAALEYARALTDLGATLRHLGRRTDAREPLRLGLDVAHRLGARALTERARRELVASGGRPQRLQLSGLDALTPSERRVAALAANGLNNPAIAQSLFLTLRTIETHLTHAYQKLGISSRSELPRALMTRRHAAPGLDYRTARAASHPQP